MLLCHPAFTDSINNVSRATPHVTAGMIPLTLWGKDSGEDFKVLVAVHVDALHPEDLTLAR